MAEKKEVAARKPRKPQPPMRKDEEGLTHNQRRLVNAMLSGAKNLMVAAKTAGYADHATAYKAWDLPHVQAAFINAARLELLKDVGPALVARRALLEHQSGYVRLETAKDVLDRAGLGVPKGEAVAAQVNIQINLGD